MNGGTETLIEVSQFWAGVHSFLWLIGEAIFHFLPVGITWSVTKKMGNDSDSGNCSRSDPGFPAAVKCVCHGTRRGGSGLGFWILYHADGWLSGAGDTGDTGRIRPGLFREIFKKITPQAISMIVVPFLSLVLAVIAAHAVLGPVGWAVGSWVSRVVYAGLTSSFRWLFANRIRFYLRTACDHRPSSHDQCHRFAADGGIWRHDAVADDRFIQYRTGIRSTGHDLFAEA